MAVGRVRSRGARFAAMTLLLGVVVSSPLRAETVPTSEQGEADRVLWEAAEPPVVRAIELRDAVPLEIERNLEDYLALDVGEPLTEDAVHRTLSSLYASGEASRISVSTRPAPGGGVVVSLSLWPNVMVNAVQIEGELAGVKRSELEARIPQEAGQPLVESRVVRGDFQLEELYARRGYLDARVTLHVTEPDPQNRVVLTYRIEPGERLTVGPVSFEGDLRPVSAEALIARMRNPPGEPYRPRVAQEDAERMRTWLIEQGYRMAEVDLAEENRQPETTQMSLAYRAELGPRVEVRVEGADLEKLEKRGLVSFLGEEGYDEALLLQTADRIKAYYQRQGHYRVEVQTRQERVPPESGAGDSGDGEGGTTDTGASGGRETLRVGLSIEPGPVYTLRDVRFEGNESYPAERLDELIETSGDRLLGLGGGRLVDEVLNADLRNLRTFYALEGFVGTHVGPPKVDLRDRAIFLTIPIEEGRRRRVGEIRFEGIETLTANALLERLPLEEGGGYNDYSLEEALDAVRARYDELGYTRARVSARRDWNPEHTVVDLIFQVEEGPQQVVGNILVTGNRKTRTPVIVRALKISAGDPVSGSRLLDLERNLYRLGIFSRVDVDFTPADLGATRRDIVIRVKEGKTRSLSFEAGFDSDDGARGLVGFSLRNVLGRAYTFRTDLRLSSREDQRRFRLAFEQPQLRYVPFGLQYQIFRIEEQQEAYDATRQIARIDLVPRAETRRFGLAMDFRHLETGDFAGPLLDDETGRIKPGILSPLEQNDDGTSRGVQVASLIPGFQWDRRDDPVEPTRGWSSSVQLQYAFPLFEAEARYLKLFAQHSQFVSLGGGRVLALGARLGAIEPLGTVAGAEGDPLLSVPLDERFFAGGRTSHRAFPRFGLGIDGETRVREDDRRASIGGNGLVLLNLEYRFPVLSAVGGAVFFDSGNVWRDWRDIDGRFRNGVGFGVRYLSPIGPLRVDVGFKLDRRPAESGYEIHFSFGNPF
jgi:outer membrane protein insertion porin family